MSHFVRFCTPFRPGSLTIVVPLDGFRPPFLLCRDEPLARERYIYIYAPASFLSHLQSPSSLMLETPSSPALFHFHPLRVHPTPVVSYLLNRTGTTRCAKCRTNANPNVKKMYSLRNISRIKKMKKRRNTYKHFSTIKYTLSIKNLRLYEYMKFENISMKYLKSPIHALFNYFLI